MINGYLELREIVRKLIRFFERGVERGGGGVLERARLFGLAGQIGELGEIEDLNLHDFEVKLIIFG